MTEDEESSTFRRQRSKLWKSRVNQLRSLRPASRWDLQHPACKSASSGVQSSPSAWKIGRIRRNNSPLSPLPPTRPRWCLWRHSEGKILLQTFWKPAELWKRRRLRVEVCGSRRSDKCEDSGFYLWEWLLWVWKYLYTWGRWSGARQMKLETLWEGGQKSTESAAENGEVIEVSFSEALTPNHSKANLSARVSAFTLVISAEPVLWMAAGAGRCSEMEDNAPKGRSFHFKHGFESLLHRLGVWECVPRGRKSSVCSKHDIYSDEMWLHQVKAGSTSSKSRLSHFWHNSGWFPCHTWS